MVRTTVSVPLLLARSLVALAALASTTALAAGCSSAPEEGAESSNGAFTQTPTSEAGACGSEASEPAVSAGSSLLTTDHVNLRDTPGTSATVLTVVPQGATVVAIGRAPRDGWYNVDWEGKVGWMFGRYLTTTDGVSLDGSCASASGDSSTSTDSFTISDAGRDQMRRLLQYAKSNNRSPSCQTPYCGSKGRCFEFVWAYIYKSGYGKIRNYGDAPGMGSDEARQFAEYFNVPANAARWGLQRLPINNPYDAPPGSIVVVPAGTPGTSHATAGDIAVATGTDDFINDGPRMQYSRSHFASGKHRALGIFAPL